MCPIFGTSSNETSLSDVGELARHNSAHSGSFVFEMVPVPA